MPLDGLAELQQTSLDYVEFLVVDDDHRLNKSMIVEDQLRHLINANYHPIVATETIDGYVDCTKLWFKCMFHLALSFLREPLTLFNTMKRLRIIYDRGDKLSDMLSKSLTKHGQPDSIG